MSALSSAEEPRPVPGSSRTTLQELEAAALARGTLEGLASGGGALHLAGDLVLGTIESREVTAVAPFDRACVSVNAETPGDSTVEVLARVLLDDGSHTDWLPLGTVASPRDAAKLPRSEAGPREGPARVAIDTIELAAPTPGPANAPEPRGRAIAVKLVLTRGSSAQGPRVRRVAIAAWKKGQLDAEPAGARHPAWGKVLPVPARSQCPHEPETGGGLCSPTSLSMVLAFHGLARPVPEVAAEVLDRATGIYGNWALNVAYAGRLGLDAQIVRMGSFAPLEAEIAAGRPVVISHRWKKGELAGAPIGSSDGHLIAVRGFTPEGDLAVNDPCADPRKGDSVERTYRRGDIERTWLRNADGIAYVIRPAKRS